MLISVVLYAKTDQVKIKKVTFSGNDKISDAVLHKAMLSRPSRFMLPVYYQEDILEDDMISLARFYQQRGFLKANLEGYEVKVDSARMTARIRIKVIEGPQTQIQAVSLIGNAALSDSLLADVHKIKLRDPLDAGDIEKAQLRILRNYADQGYLEARVNPIWSLDADSLNAVLDFVITEGIQYYVGSIRIIGLEKTKPQVVKRELSFKNGQTISYSKLLQSQRRLYLTGLFESVNIRPAISGDSTGSTIQDLNIHLKENQAGALNFSVGYGTLDRARFMTEFKQDNIKGTGNKVGITGRISAIQRQLRVAFTNPRIMDTYWQGDLNMGYSLQFQPGYDFQSWGGIIAVKRQLDKSLSMTLAFRNELNRLMNVKLSSTDGVYKANVHSLGLRFTRDSRDNLFSPTRGTLLEWENEIAGGPVTSSNSFYRSVIKGRFFKTLWNGPVFGSALEIGWVTTPAGNLRVSLQERFYSGGSTSLRGYAHREIGPMDESGYPKGGFYKIIWNVGEIRVPVYKGLQVSSFADIGNVWWDYSDILTDQWAADVGLGIGYNTALGVVRVDVGRPVGPVEAKKPWIYHLSMGYAF